jgi:hypothetical protein
MSNFAWHNTPHTPFALPNSNTELSGHNQPALVAELIVWGGQMFQVLKVI